MTYFQRFAIASFICLELLIFVGAVVRATGSGLGCPDWPFCYGCWVPPTRVEEIDFSKLNLEKFRKKAAQYGRDPESITVETLKAEFDPVATWIEYLNRLTSLPLGLAVVVLFFLSWRQPRSLTLASTAALILLLTNAWLGAKVVLSGLQAGIITTHMALAIVMLNVLVFVNWKSGAFERILRSRGGSVTRGSFLAGGLLMVLVIIEGLMGSQVREMTDHLARTHAGESRLAWTTELEQSWVYLVHRSFSWLVLGTSIWFLITSNHLRWLEGVIVGIVFAQMILGIVLAHIGILAVAQILHIGLSSLLVSGLGLWLLDAAGWVRNRS
jgi:cytochrome c oxidase assembly protein subunit 15